jgi:Asp-tRNA(Asn)/Glu-tRNA(Gln) amidotransferase A subunit family amidase
MTRIGLLLLILCALRAGAEMNPTAKVAASADVLEKTILELQAAMDDGSLTSRQLVEIYLARIAAYDKQGPSLNAIAAINPEARRIADALDAERRATGARGPLHGIPVLVKDNYETIEMPTSAGSIALATFHPKSDAFLVKKLRDAGAVILGKTNMHELAAGITTVGSRFGQTRNPYDLDRNPGGSSGGTGAAVAANFAAAGMGSDTCGSIRIPAAHNNLVGLRGTQGLSSRSGIVPLSATQDIGGPLARTITDLAILLDATVGADPADPITMKRGGEHHGTFREALRADALTGARLGVLRASFGSAPEDQEVTTLVNKTLEALRQAGATTIDVVIPGLDDLLRDSSLINSEFKFDLAEYLANHPDAPVTSLGDVIDRGLYHAALEERFRARNSVEKRGTDEERRARIKQRAIREAAIATIDEHQLSALIYPTVRRRPARIGDPQAGTNCYLSSHSGLPALAVPAAWTADGLPIGVDLVGPPWSDAKLLSLGYAMEQTLKLRRAPFSTPALVGGKPPVQSRFTVSLDSGTDRFGSVEFAYDETTAQLTYTTRLAPRSAENVTGVWIHRMIGDKPAAAVHLLHNGGSPVTTGTTVLTSSDREDLAAGRLTLRIYTKRNARGMNVRLPGRR